MRAATVARLRRLLLQERAAILQGELQRLARLTPRKAILLTRLAAMAGPATGDERAETLRLRAEAARNARLLQAALEGIRDARALLGRVREGGRSQTYAKDGVRAELDRPATALRRKA